MKKEFYSKLYIAEDDEHVTEYIKDTGLVWVSKHWDWIYDKKPRTCESEALEDYTLVFCESDEEFKALDAKLDTKNPSIFDYSFEFEYPSLLVETEYLEQCLK